MIFFFSVFIAVIYSWWVAAKAHLPSQEWFILFLMVFLGLWSGIHFWGMVLENLAAFIWWSA